MEKFNNIILEETKLIQYPSNAEKIGMSLEDLALIEDDFEFGNIEFELTPIEL